MWQRFSEKARQAVFSAQEEAGKLGENCVGTEHLLLGILKSDDCTALRAISGLGVSAADVRREVEGQVTKGDSRLGQDMQLTPRAKRAIDCAYNEARRMDNDYIGTEHLLLGLLLEGDGLACRTLEKLGVTLDGARSEVSRLLTGGATDKGDSGLSGKDCLEIAALTVGEIESIFEMTRALKDVVPLSAHSDYLKGKTLAMIFEKPSLRTRVSFETGIFQLGGHGIYLSPADIGLGKRESIADVARTLDRMCDIIMARVFEHEKVTELAKYSSVPVINGLSDLEHPCQALADFYTVIEKKGDLKGLKMAFIGDGNNVAHSLMLLAAKVGTDFTIGCPEGYEPDPKVTAQAEAFAKETGAKIEIVADPVAAVSGADVVYTDVWASMGQEEEAAAREKAFAAYQVNKQLMAKAKPDAIFMHCLPAHRGSEVTDDVVDSTQSVVFDEAENRLHVQKAVMALVAG